MPKTLWLLPDADTGELAVVVDDQGRPILCEECPCTDEDCVDAVNMRVGDMLSEADPDTHQPIWDLVDTYTSDFHCATWQHDIEQDTWTLSNPASGSLLVALRVGSTVADTAESAAWLMTYAKVLVNLQTGMKRVVGCECRVRDHECVPRALVLDDYDIAGALAVWSPGEDDEYTPADNCRVDTCDLLKFKLQIAQYWHGGTLMGEGYYDWLLTPHMWEPEYFRYQPFLQAIKWQSSETGYSVTYIDCDCEYIDTHDLGADETCLEYAGICTLEDPCIPLMLLHNRAVVNGWAWLDEGILVHRAICTNEYNWSHAFGDWYVYDGYSRYMAAADAGDRYYVVGCSCYVSEVLKAYSSSDPVDPATNPADYNMYMEYPGACDCVDKRELYLTYPELFGIVDISYGNHSKYRYTYTAEIWDPETGEPTGETETRTAFGICDDTAQTAAACCQGQAGGVRTLSNNYIDYRSFCYIYKSFDSNCQQGLRIGRIDPRNSYIANSWSGAGPFQNAEFVGHVEPFTKDPDIRSWDGGFSFEGQIYQWYWDSMGGGGEAWTECFYSEAERDAVCAATPPPQPTNLRFCDVSHGMPGFAPRVSPPDTTTTLIPCESWDETEQDPILYCAINAHWKVGRQVGENQWIVYREQYIETNKGWLRYGESGYVPSFTLYGIDGPQPDNPDDDYYYGYGCYDRVLTAHVDEDMHGCTPDMDWGFDDSDEEDPEEPGDEPAEETTEE